MYSNSTNSIVISVRGLYVHSNEYTQLYDFTCASPCDSKAKFKYYTTQNFIASIR